jgi:hypothetical protein
LYLLSSPLFIASPVVLMSITTLSC